MVPGTRYLPACVPVCKGLLSHVRWRLHLTSLLSGAKCSTVFCLFVPEACLTFHRMGRERLVPESSIKSGGDGKDVSVAAASLSRALLCCGSPALEGLSTARFCGVPVGTEEMPRVPDLTTGQLISTAAGGGESSSAGQNEQSECTR